MKKGVRRGVPKDSDYGDGGMLHKSKAESGANKQLLSNNPFSRHQDNNNDNGVEIMNFFKDGEKRIDFILAYVKSDGDDGKTNKFKIYRETYLAQLKKKGLVLEDAQPTSSKNTNNNLFKHRRYVSFRKKKGDDVLPENDAQTVCYVFILTTVWIIKCCSRR